MKSATSLALLAALCAVSATALAQQGGTTTTTTTTTTSGTLSGQTSKGGTGTGTGTTLTTETSKTGTGTGTLTTSTAAPVSPWTLTAQSSSVVSPGANTITLLLPADTTAAPETKVTYTVTLSSSDSACTVPPAVDLTWYAATGGSSLFKVDCAAVSTNRNVTITAGTANASFDLLKSRGN